MLSEFSLITRFFDRPIPPNHANTAVALGIGDDCALLRCQTGMQYAISTDMLVEGRHFFPHADPYFLGHKTLAVNLSDLAAMGARPVAFTLALSLPEANAAWLEAFSAGLFALADDHACTLIGGDTTKGPLTLCVTIFGELPVGASLQRCKAQVGDEVWVSGNLGDARLALGAYRQELSLAPDVRAIAAPRLHQPTPRIALGLALRTIAHAAIDISDGLIGDLGHILERSHVGATVHLDKLPFGPALRTMPQPMQYTFALTGGDDYELCFTAPPSQHATILAAGHATNTPVQCIGHITPEPGLRLINHAGEPVTFDHSAFDHFSTP